MGEATVLADIAIYDCPEGNLEAVAHILSETGFSLRDGIGAHDRGQLVLGQRYWCDEFCGGNELFEQLAYLGCVGLFQKGADYLRSPAVVYIAQGEWRKLHAELFKAAPLVPVALVESVLEDGSLDAFARLDEAMGGDVRRIVEVAAVARGDREVAACVRGLGPSDDTAPAARSGLRVGL